MAMAKSNRYELLSRGSVAPWWQEDFDKDDASNGLWYLEAGEESVWSLDEPEPALIINTVEQGLKMIAHELETDDTQVLLQWVVDNFNHTFKKTSGEVVGTLDECWLVDSRSSYR